MEKREVKIQRKTKETNIELSLNLDGSGNYQIDTGIAFFDHMLSLFSKHGLFDLKIKAKGDIDVDFHHLVEDVGICLGEALNVSLGKKKKINRYGFFILPMDEALILVSLDLSGRAYLSFNLKFKKRKVGNFDTELIEEFLRAFVNSAKINLHIQQLSGKNTHHLIEAVFKALGKALSIAVKIDKRIKDLSSTKGVL